MSPSKSAKKPPGGPKKNGRPPGSVGMREYVRGLIGQEGEKAFDILWEIAEGKRKSKKWIGGGGDSGPVEVTQLPSVKEQHDAAALLLERIHGKTPQEVKADVSYHQLTDDQVDSKLAALLAVVQADAE